MSELSKCPLCGGKVYSESDDDFPTFWVCCDKCDLYAVQTYCREDAIDEWEKLVSRFPSKTEINSSNTVNIRETLEQALAEVNTLIDIALYALWKWDEIQSIDREEEKRDQFFATIDQSRYYAHNLMVTTEQLKKAESTQKGTPEND